MDKRISSKLFTRLTSWSQFVKLFSCCYILFFIISYSPVNCVETKANLNLTSCILTVNNNVYNLSSLIRNDGDQPWQLNTRMSKNFLLSHSAVFINLCRPLPIFPIASIVGCRDAVNSSVCQVNLMDDSTISYGDYNNIEITHNPDIPEELHIIMNSSNSNYSTDIYLHCNPTLTNNQPILTEEKANQLIIEWYDAAACPVDDIIGEDCSVYVPSIGKTFDLSPLRKPEGYDFPEEGYDYFINVCGPINVNGCRSDSGICHYSQNGKMSYSLGKWNDQVIYSNGVLKLAYDGGDPYRDLKKTPRSTEILFICNNSAGVGKPDFIEETNRTYIIHWETKHACPKITHIVDCVWQNSTHRLDLSPFSKTEGNAMIALPNGIVVINACRPVNPKYHSLPKCPLSAGVCLIMFKGTENRVLNLGQPSTPPQLLFDDQINLLYTEGDPCPSDPSKRYVTRITFICDRNVDEGEPTLIQGSSSKCEWLFEWKTNLVCKARPIYSHQCIFEDQLNKLKVDLTQVFSTLPLISEQNNSTIKTFFINVCSKNSGKDFKEMTISKLCTNSPICIEETFVAEDKDKQQARYLTLGNLESNNSEYFFQGESLILRFFNGSTCDGNQTWSSEIDIRCHASSSKTTFVRRETDKCIHKIFLESSLVCGLKPPSCTYRFNNSIIDLRELSSLTHAWKTKVAAYEKVYYFNLCNKIPKGHIAYDGDSSVVECDVIEGVEHCGYPLGRKGLMSMGYDEEKNHLTITYAKEESKACIHNDSVITKIKLICSSVHRDPKFTQKIDTISKCEYQFEWETYLACFDHEPERTERKLTRLGNYFIDSRSDHNINMAINMSEIFNSFYTVTDGKYNYVINLAGVNGTINSKDNCKNAAICQKEINGTFERDIGSISTEMMVTQGRKVKLKLTANNHQKCGKNSQKNVTTTIFFECDSPESGISSPRFFYESNNCDYIFLWDADIVCSGKMLSAEMITQLEKEATINSNLGDSTSFFGGNSSTTASLFGDYLLALCIIVCAVVPLAWIVFRLSDREKRNYLVHWIRSKFRAPVITSFHYSQVSSDSTKLVSINDDL